MKISKITKMLPITLALAFVMPCAYAVGENPNDSAIYSLTLPDYLKIKTTTTPTPSNVSFGDNYSSASIDSALTGAFTVVSNKLTRNIYLQGTCAVKGTGTAGSAGALYADGTDATKLKLVFTNESNLPASTSVTNITGGSPSPADNADAIAFALTPVITSDVHGDDSVTATFDTSKKQVVYAVKNGTSTFTYTTQQNNEPNTFDTRDTMGTYKATLKLTDTSL